MSDIPDTEPVEVVRSQSGEPVLLPASTADALKWSARKYQLIKAGHRSDDAEQIIRREQAEQG